MAMPISFTLLMNCSLDKDVENPSPQQLSVVAGFELDYNFLSFNKAGWKRHWNYPSIGFTLLGLKLNDIYGTTDPSINMMLAAYPHVNIPIHRSDIGQLDAKAGMGITVFDKKSVGLGSYAAFNFNVIVIDGHDFEQIEAAVEEFKKTTGKPTAIIAKTVKGKGVSFMENNVGWHGKAPNDEQYEIAMNDLNAILAEVK